MKRAKTLEASVGDVRTFARYWRSFPGLWAGVSECVYASVESYAHEKTWLADCHVSLPNERREQWNTVRRFASRDEAAAYAAAFVLEANRIVEAVQRGEETYMPHRAMAAACKLAVDADPKLRAVAARKEMFEVQRVRQDLELAWYRARDFRDFLQAPLSEVA